MENVIDDLLQNILEVADRPLNLPECKELLKFIEDLKKLDDELFKDKVEGYLQLAEYMEYSDDCIFPNSKAKNAYISKRVIEGMQSLKNQNIKDPVQSIMFLYSEELLYSVGVFFNHLWLHDIDKKEKYEGEELLKRMNAIWRITTSIALQSMIYELQNDNSFVEIKEESPHILNTMYEIGKKSGILSSIEDMPPKEIAHIIHSEVSRKHKADGCRIQNDIDNELENIIRQIADEKFNNGDTDWHHNMAIKLDSNFTALKKGNQNTIKDKIFLKYLPELKEIIKKIENIFEEHKKKVTFEEYAKYFTFEKYIKQLTSEKEKKLLKLEENEKQLILEEYNKKLTLEEYNKKLTLEEYKQYLKKHRTKLYHQYINKEIIQAIIRPVAACYNSASGINNEAMRIELCRKWKPE